MKAYRTHFELIPGEEKSKGRRVFEIYKIVQKKKDSVPKKKLIKKFVDKTHDRAKAYIAAAEKRI